MMCPATFEKLRTTSLVRRPLRPCSTGRTDRVSWASVRAIFQLVHEDIQWRSLRQLQGCHLRRRVPGVVVAGNWVALRPTHGGARWKGAIEKRS